MTALRVLHVDDEADIREVVAISLSLDSQFSTRGCDSGQEALVIAAEWLPDVILLDVMMPVLDGPATLTRLRENALTADIPVVFMTARAQMREQVLFRSLGAAGIIPKPFDPMTLAASVRNFMKPSDNGLTALRNAFLKRVNDDALKLAQHWFVLKNKRESATSLAGIRDLAHGLAGAGGIFGFVEISDAASALEEATILVNKNSCSTSTIASALDHLLACVEKNNSNRMEPSRLSLTG